MCLWYCQLQSSQNLQSFENGPLHPPNCRSLFSLIIPPPVLSLVPKIVGTACPHLHFLRAAPTILTAALSHPFFVVYLPPNRSPTPFLVLTPKHHWLSHPQTILTASYYLALTTSIFSVTYWIKSKLLIQSSKAFQNPSLASFFSAARLYQALSTEQAPLQLLQCKFLVSSRPLFCWPSNTPHPFLYLLLFVSFVSCLECSCLSTQSAQVLHETAQPIPAHRDLFPEIFKLLQLDSLINIINFLVR